MQFLIIYDIIQHSVQQLTWRMSGLLTRQCSYSFFSAICYQQHVV